MQTETRDRDRHSTPVSISVSVRITMLNPFRVLDPATVGEASSELARLGERARIYAGGAELLLLLRHRLIQADTLVDIKRIAELNRIAWEGGLLRIGATVTHHRLEREPLVREHLPMLASAESQVANIRVRNQGTLGGNLCFNDPHSDPPTALLVHEAAVAVAGPKGERRIPLSDFLVGMYATALEADELLTEVVVPPLPPGWGEAYLRIHRLQRPTLGVAAAARLQNGSIEGVRLAVGCVGPKAERLAELEAKLRGTTLADALRVIEDEKSYLKQLLQPVDDLLGSADYKLYMTRVLLSRALSQALQSPSPFPLPLEGGEDEREGVGWGALGRAAEEINKDEGGRMKDESFECRVSSYELKPKTPQDVALSLTINGRPWKGQVPVEETLLEFVRARLGLTGTKRSCESQVCGACTVLVDNRAISSCNTLAFEAHGKSVLTIEGLAAGEQLDPLQEAFIRNVGAQCGYCTPGQIMAAKALLMENPSPTRDQIAEWLSGNICRCGAYPAIAASILEASHENQRR